jgi:hypothetical protein
VIVNKWGNVSGYEMRNVNQYYIILLSFYVFLTAMQSVKYVHQCVTFKML